VSRDFKMPFGKYKGETLEEIYVEDVSYLEWLKSATVPGESIHEKIEQCFKEMRNVRICK
jgi:uncharacterized protein (DUF3820 family)